VCCLVRAQGGRPGPSINTLEQLGDGHPKTVFEFQKKYRNDILFRREHPFYRILPLSLTFQCRFGPQPKKMLPPRPTFSIIFGPDLHFQHTQGKLFLGKTKKKAEIFQNWSSKVKISVRKFKFFAPVASKTLINFG